MYRLLKMDKKCAIKTCLHEATKKYSTYLVEHWFCFDVCDECYDELVRYDRNG